MCLVDCRNIKHVPLFNVNELYRHSAINIKHVPLFNVNELYRHSAIYMCVLITIK